MTELVSRYVYTVTFVTTSHEDACAAQATIREMTGQTPSIIATGLGFQLVEASELYAINESTARSGEGREG